MTPIAFEIARTIAAPVDRVFARLSDDGHSDWLAGKVSLLGRCGRWFAVRERTISVDALKASFERADRLRNWSPTRGVWG